MTAAGYELCEVRVEDWILAALRMQHVLSLKPRRRRLRRPVRPAARPRSARGSLWVMLAACCVGYCLL